MATQRKPLVRVFYFNGITLQDPLPGQSVEAVRRVHALQYAAILNAKIDGPDLQGDQQAYTYRVQVGTKG